MALTDRPRSERGYARLAGPKRQNARHLVQLSLRVVVLGICSSFAVGPDQVCDREVCERISDADRILRCDLCAGKEIAVEHLTIRLWQMDHRVPPHVATDRRVSPAAQQRVDQPRNNDDDLTTIQL